MPIDGYEALMNANYDILKEIGSIGMGHASTALSQMLNMKVSITIPEVYALTYDAAAEYLRERKSGSYVVRIGLQGDSKGDIFQILDKDFVSKVIQFFFQTQIDGLDGLDGLYSSVLHEIGNITSGAYCNSLASMTGLFIDISIPSHCPDCDFLITAKKDAISPDFDIAGHVKKVFLIKNSFFFGADEVKSSFLFVPELETVKSILKKLKEYYGFQTSAAEPLLVF
ncbi:MAG: chemotaxis protein CheC [Eubacterium sp.]|jgi:chemotaxis protein CheC|nr:chemotaxis protein CheC [Eubacterium sp.]